MSESGRAPVRVVTPRGFSVRVVPVLHFKDEESEPVQKWRADHDGKRVTADTPLEAAKKVLDA